MAIKKRLLRRYGATKALGGRPGGEPHWPDQQDKHDCKKCWNIKASLKQLKSMPWYYTIAAQ